MTYNDYYKKEIKDTQKEFTLKLNDGDYKLLNGELKKFNNILPLHPNHKVLYETIYLLHPSKAVEVCFGGGRSHHKFKFTSS